MMKCIQRSALLIVVCSTPAFAQQPPNANTNANPNPMSRVLQRWWAIGDYVVRIAEAMPEEKYGFNPFPDVRSFADQVGHVTDAHYMYCSRVRGEAHPAPAPIEGRVTVKAELVAKLKASVAYCDSAYNSATDASLAESWRQGPNRGVKLGPLVGNLAHDNEHSSTMIMLMRMSGVSPPPLDPDDQTFQAAYTVTVKDTAAQLFHVTASFSGVTTSQLDVALPTYTPGSFGTGNYAANVRDLRASDGSGRALTVEQSRPSSWRVRTNGPGRIDIEFDYHATLLSSDQAKITSRYAFFTGTQLFLEPTGYRERPSTVRFVVPRGWRIATPLVQGADPATFVAANYDELVDAPAVLGHFDVVDFDVEGKAHHFVTVPRGAFPRANVDSFVKWIPPIIRQQRAIFGSLPYEKYVFFYIKPSSESPAAGGVEHGTSHVVLGLNETLGAGLLSLASHELFHLWNTKRIRPAERWPYDYSREQPTLSLWASEGMTSYYGELTRYRAGVGETPSNDTTALLRELAYRISGVESRTTGGVQAEPTASAPWTSRNEYWTGEILGALLDISLLADTRGERRLDDVFRKLYAEYFERGRGYTPDDLRRVVSDVAGRDHADFFRRHIWGAEPPPYDSIFGLAGYQLVRRSRELAVVQGLANASRTPAGREVRVVRAGSPAAAAGLTRGDLILSIGGTPVNELELTNLFGENWIGGAFAGRPGPTVLKVSRDGVVRDVPIVLATRDDRRVELESVPAPTRAQLAVRAAWLRR